MTDVETGPFRPNPNHVAAVKTDRRLSNLEARRVATKEMLREELTRDAPDYRRVLLTILETL